jgi:hypothetical protein
MFRENAALGRGTSTESRTEAPTHMSGSASIARRAFLRRGGLVAGGAGLAAALHTGTAEAQVSAQAIDFTYLPVGPTRVYDSRQGGGPLYNGQERILYTGYETLVPPPLAITVNLTVTQTNEAGFLALFPGDISFPGTSSINWFGNNQDTANNAFVFIPNDGTVVLRCGGTGGARTQILIDWIAASVPISYISRSATDTRGAVSAAHDQLSQFGQSWVAR